MALAYIVGTATQGSADAFKESEIQTALSGQTQRAFRVREILFELPNIGNAAGVNVEVSLTRRTMAAMPNITDRNVIAKVTRQQNLTTSGAYIHDRVVRLTFSEDDELLIVEDPIYFQIDTASTTAANTGYARVGYELVNVSANDRLQLALQSLNEAS